MSEIMSRFVSFEDFRNLVNSLDQSQMDDFVSLDDKSNLKVVKDDSAALSQVPQKPQPAVGKGKSKGFFKGKVVSSGVSPRGTNAQPSFGDSYTFVRTRLTNAVGLHLNSYLTSRDNAAQKFFLSIQEELVGGTTLTTPKPLTARQISQIVDKTATQASESCFAVFANTNAELVKKAGDAKVALGKLKQSLPDAEMKTHIDAILAEHQKNLADIRQSVKDGTCKDGVMAYQKQYEVFTAVAEGLQNEVDQKLKAQQEALLEQEKLAAAKKELQNIRDDVHAEMETFSGKVTAETEMSELPDLFRKRFAALSGKSAELLHAAVAKRKKTLSSLDVFGIIASMNLKNVKKCAGALLFSLAGIGGFLLGGCTSSVRPAVVFSPGAVEVLVAPGAPKTVLFAAGEATNFLSRVLGAPVPLVTAPTPGRAALVVGTNDWTKAAGLAPEMFARDGFAIRTDAAARRVYLAGVDSPTADLPGYVDRGQTWLLQTFERASCFAVYEFLERFAGVRFYFAGDVGTVVPRLAAIDVPETDVVVEPLQTVRDPYVGGDGKWFDEPADEKAAARYRGRQKALNAVRLRLQTERIPCCHGSNGFMYPERFGQTHPEYFQLKKDGTRNLARENHWQARQLCHSSPVVEEMYQDAKAYLSGESAQSRGVPSRGNPAKYAWNGNCVGGKYVDVMPQDGYQECHCEKCQKAYDKSAPNHMYATDLVWGNTARIARRLAAEGVKGYVTQMAYPPYRNVPAFDLPPNILVMVAEGGPWCARTPSVLSNQLNEVKAWAQKLGHKVWTWTYPHKYPAPHDPDVPCWAPRAWFSYYKAMMPYSNGTFAESESDKSVYNLMNYYVFTRLAWDPNADVDVLLDEFNHRMFGAAAPEMAKFLDDLEDLWIDRVVGRLVETEFGPSVRKPSEFALFKSVYTRERFAAWRTLLAAAERKTAGDAEAARRVAFFRAQFLDPLEARAKSYLDRLDVDLALARRRAKPPQNLLDGTARAWGRQNVSTNEFVTGPEALRAFSKGEGPNRGYYVTQYLAGERRARLKPNTRYRVSFFLKIPRPLEMLSRGGGFHCEFNDGHAGRRHPASPMLEATDGWIYQEFEWTTGPEIGRQPYVCLRLAGTRGEAFYDDVVLEEADDAGDKNEEAKR